MSWSMTSVQQEWAERLSRWERSGLSRDEFAEKEGVLGRRLVWWRWNLRRLRAAHHEPAPPTALSFVRLEPSSSPPPCPLELLLVSGRTIRIPAGFDEETLSRVVVVLERGIA